MQRSMQRCYTRDTLTGRVLCAHAPLPFSTFPFKRAAIFTAAAEYIGDLRDKTGEHGLQHDHRRCQQAAINISRQTADIARRVQKLTVAGMTGHGRSPQRGPGPSSCSGGSWISLHNWQSISRASSHTKSPEYAKKSDIGGMHPPSSPWIRHCTHTLMTPVSLLLEFTSCRALSCTSRRTCCGFRECPLSQVWSWQTSPGDRDQQHQWMVVWNVRELTG